MSKKNRNGKPTQFQIDKIRALGATMKGVKTYRDAENLLKRLANKAKHAKKPSAKATSAKIAKVSKKPVAKKPVKPVKHAKPVAKKTAKPVPAKKLPASVKGKMKLNRAAYTVASPSGKELGTITVASNRPIDDKFAASVIGDMFADLKKFDRLQHVFSGEFIERLAKLV